MSQDIENINKLFAPFGLKVDGVIKGAQDVKYRINLPLDLEIQGKIRRAETNIKYALPTALDTNEFTYKHDKNAIYIERRSDVFNVVNFNDFRDKLHTNTLNLVLGMDENGQKIVTNLSKAPHILVGGTTGSGKSELLHCFVASLIEGMAYTDVSLLIIDPKRAEFSPYKSCRSIQVVTDMKAAYDCLIKAVDIMEERYIELEKNGAKDIYKYTGNMKMYPIVIIIDELADLIQTYPQVEQPIVRIAQKARACGIHLIIGTQSPRKDVVTGLIKSNIPTRIALHTSSQMESRIIMDKSGAETLLGSGDMLFLANGAFNPIRIQSAYVDEGTKIDLANSIYIQRSTPIQAETTSNYNMWKDENYLRQLNAEIEQARMQNAQPTPPRQKQKRVGLIRGMINLMKVKPIMFRTDDYPPQV